MTTSIATEHRDASSEVLDVIYHRRAVRSYKPDAIAEPRLRALLDAAVNAPTAMHQEPWQFVIVQDRKLLRELSDRAKDLAQREAAHHGNVLKPRHAAGDGIPSPMADPAFNIFYDAGTLVVICAELTNDFVVADCWLAAENLMLAARADGLGTCCVGFAVAMLNSVGVKKQLAIPSNVQAFAPIIVGVPRTEQAAGPRKPPVVLRWITP